jgi:hypothetical protein
MNPIYLETRFKSDESFEGLPCQFAIITAYATTGEHWPDRKNQAADNRLKVNLVSRFTVVKRIHGYSPSTGHAKPGWLVNCSFIESCEIGLAFKQNAIYRGGGEQLFVS